MDLKILINFIERFFLKIIEQSKETGMFKIDSDMINLIGCSKENFFKLLELMEYRPKKISDSKDEFFVYKPKFISNKNEQKSKKINKDSPFDKLSELRFR